MYMQMAEKYEKGRFKSKAWFGLLACDDEPKYNIITEWKFGPVKITKNETEEYITGFFGDNTPNIWPEKIEWSIEFKVKKSFGDRKTSKRNNAKNSK